MRLLLTIITTIILSCAFAQQEESFEQFVSRLEKIAINEDIISLKNILNDTIFESNDICGYPGCDRDEFLKFHFTTDTINEDWRLLRQIMKYGFVKVMKDSAIVQFNEVSEIYEAPAYWRNIDVNQELQILEKNTEIKESPDFNSGNLLIVDSGKFSCNCCIYNQTDEDVIEDEKGNFWIKITLNDQKTGYVLLQNTSQRWMKVLEIGKVNGKWKIIAFYGGEPC